MLQLKHRMLVITCILNGAVEKLFVLMDANACTGRREEGGGNREKEGGRSGEQGQQNFGD